ncbi:MAG: hypothetical protein PHQ35_10310 [Phycisphaerae bacterium]|nr:hypothetical protein [Phycisphaerae bacterium]MDD5382003.1 hypothetical protein [Phycisphaerae bacterium]
MKVAAVAQMFLLLLCVTGCGTVNTELSPKADSGLNHLSAYGPVKIDIMPLTEFTAADDEEPSKIKVYVSLLDAFDCQIKTPAVFRFELYDRVSHSAEPKGKRIIIWPDINLNDAAKNNEHWMDFLRTYEFDLPLEPKTNKSCILQVTALCPGGKRLSADFTLK